jgi:hypothetical protein
MKDQTSIKKVLLKLASVFPEKKLEPEGIDVYCELLEDIPNEILNTACKVCLLNCRFFPTIAEIRTAAMPLLQEYNLKNQQLLINDLQSKCNENVIKNEKNYPICKLEENECEFGNTGKCLKWNI